MYTKLCGEGSFNFLKNILVKYLRKQMYRIPFFPVFHISNEQWIYLGVFCLTYSDNDEPYMTLQIILNYVKCTEILKSTFTKAKCYLYRMNCWETNINLKFYSKINYDYSFIIKNSSRPIFKAWHKRAGTIIPQNC